MEQAASSSAYAWTRKIWKDQVDGVFLDALRERVARHILPVADEIDRQDIYPVSIIKQLAADGYTALTLPTAWRGSGVGYEQCAAVFEEASYASAAVGISLITIFQAQKIISLFAPPSLQRQVLPQFRDGLITAYALTESNHGSDIRSLDTKAVKTAEGWMIQGRKSFITSGSAAEAFIILAQTPVGVSTFFVRRDTPGVSIARSARATTFGLRNGPHVDLILENVRIPPDHLIGTEGKGVRQAVTVLNFSRTVAGAISIGIARAAFDGALAFAAERKAFDQTVLEFQGIQWYFADMLAQIDAARMLVYAACRALDDDAEVPRYTSEAKLLASRVATKVAEQAVQICGAYGVTEDAPFGRYLRDAKAYEIAGGSSEVLKNTLGKYLLAFAQHNILPVSS